MKLLLPLLILLSCSKNTSPESTLREFINMRFSNGQNKSDLIQLTTGEFKASLEEMTEEDFKLFTGFTIVKNSLDISSSNCGLNECAITYVLRYTTTDDGVKTMVTEVKKIAQLSYVDDYWKISDVQNLKSFHDSLRPIEVTK